MAAAADDGFEAASAAWQAAALAERDALLAGAVAAGVVASTGAAAAALAAAERTLSADVTCGVCFDAVLETRCARFGLLTGCSHAFCLECIRAWRARIDLPRDTVRSCPLCRTISYFVIPCDRYITSAGRKALVNEEYSKSQAVIHCRYFDGGRGTCPFGSSCRYAHILPDGTAAVYVKPAVRVDGDGGVTVTRQYKLAEFLGGAL